MEKSIDRRYDTNTQIQVGHSTLYFRSSWLSGGQKATVGQQWCTGWYGHWNCRLRQEWSTAQVTGYPEGNALECRHLVLKYQRRDCTVRSRPTWCDMWRGALRKWTHDPRFGCKLGRVRARESAQSQAVEPDVFCYLFRLFSFCAGEQRERALYSWILLFTGILPLGLSFFLLLLLIYEQKQQLTIRRSSRWEAKWLWLQTLNLDRNP